MKKSKAYFRNLWQYFFASRDNNTEGALRAEQKQVVEEALKNKDNPYLFGYATYVALYADQEEKATYYKNINRVLLLLVLFFAVLFALASFTSHTKPYVVGVNQNGQVFDMNQSVNTVSVPHLLPKLAAHFMQTYVKAAFSVSIDGDVLRTNQSTAFAMSRGAALTTLTQYYATLKPKELAKHSVIAVAINYVLPVSAHTFKVGWVQKTKDAKSGQVISIAHFTGQFTYHWDKHATSGLVSKFNALGFYIDAITWSQNHGDN